jgi:hypothetical protein
MKKLYQYTMILLACVLGACSSLEVSDPYSENLPAGFTAQGYMDVHPILRKLQIKDYVEVHNAYVQDSLQKLGLDYAAVKAADDAAFAALDPAVLAAICADKFLGGYPAASCANPAADEAIMKDLMEFNFVGVPDDFTALTQVPIDEIAISQQYVVFGQAHGWAYRWCDATELANPGRDQAIIDAQAKRAASADKFVADPGIYCMDAATGALHKVNQ